MLILVLTHNSSHVYIQHASGDLQYVEINIGMRQTLIMIMIKCCYLIQFLVTASFSRGDWNYSEGQITALMNFIPKAKIMFCEVTMTRDRPIWSFFEPIPIISS